MGGLWLAFDYICAPKRAAAARALFTPPPLLQQTNIPPHPALTSMHLPPTLLIVSWTHRVIRQKTTGVRTCKCGAWVTGPTAATMLACHQRNLGSSLLRPNVPEGGTRSDQANNTCLPFLPTNGTESLSRTPSASASGTAAVHYATRQLGLGSPIGCPSTCASAIQAQRAVAFLRDGAWSPVLADDL